MPILLPSIVNKIMFELLALTYSEFDNHVGPQLLYQFPLDVVSKDDFENISEYVIVGKHLCGKAIAVRTEQYQFVNYSVAIDNQKYERNALLFAVGVVLSLDADMDVYKALLRRLATTLIALEQEKEYLFQLSSKETLQGMLQSAYEQLGRNRKAFLQFDESNLLIIELFQAPPPPVVINNYDVPVLLHDKIGLVGLPWDITIQHLIHHINGENHVKRLSKVADMDLDCVKRSLQLLVHYGCCVITDVLHFSNVYALNPVAFDLLDACNFIELNTDSLGSAEGCDGVNVDALPAELRTGYRLLVEVQLFCCATIAEPPLLSEVCQVLFRFRGSRSLRDVLIACLGLETDDAGGQEAEPGAESAPAAVVVAKSPGDQEHDKDKDKDRALNNDADKEKANENEADAEKSGVTSGATSCLSRINVKRLIAILVSKDIIRRLHEYPIYTPPESSSDAVGAIVGVEHFEPTRISGKGWNVDKERLLLNGDQSLESLCCAFNVAKGDIIQNKSSVCVVYK